MRTVHGTCHHDCPDSCGWTVTVDDTVPEPVAVKFRGDPEHPYSKGELCPKVNRFLDRVYSPDRILHPLRRTGPKGSGEFERISWDDALAEIATRLHDVIDTHGAEAILPFSDAGNQSLLAMQGVSGRFFNHLGASRLVRAICGPTVGAGVSMTNGSALGMDPLEIRHAKLIILWATNTKLTNRHLWPTIEAGPRRRRQDRRDRSDPHGHGRGRRLVPAAPTRHRHRADAGDDARAHPRRPRRRRVGGRPHHRLRRAR